MSTPVRGPDDAKPGDFVFVGTGGDLMRGPVATVVKATASHLTVDIDGKRSTKKYTALVETGMRYSLTNPLRKEQRPQFQRLSAWDRWRRVRPETPDLKYASVMVPHAEYRRDSIGTNENGHAATDTAIRDRPDEVCAQIHALSAWLKAEPGKEEQ